MTRREIKRAVGYLRVSTADQADSGAGLQAQREAIAAYARLHGWELVEVFEDHASGKSMSGRPQLRKALDSVRRGQSDALVVAKVDRVTRSLRDLADLLEDSRRQGWALVLLDLDIDTSTPMGEAMAHISGVFAQLERRLIGQRTKDALAVKRAQGVRLGRPILIDPATEGKIVRLRKRGVTFQAIAATLNLGDEKAPTGGPWSWQTVSVVARRHLKEPVKTRRRGIRQE